MRESTFKMFLENHEHYDVIKADIPLPASVYLLSRLFERSGKSLFAVGGAIRDFLYHKTHDPKGSYSPKDVDLATDAPPKQIISILSSPVAEAEGIKVFPKGEAFGVISAVIHGEEFEIATFREEWYDPTSGDGRRPDKVNFSTPGKDAQRRDLTMNALFYDIQEKEIRDYNVDSSGQGLGFKDIKNLVARPVGNAQERFREDKLRIPRLVRFFSRFNPGEIKQHLDQSTLEAIEEFKDLAGVSPERISAEFLAGLAKCISPVNYLKNYLVLGLMPSLFPGMKIEPNDIDHIKNNRNPKAILAWLLRNNGDSKIIKNELNEMKYPSEIFDRVEFLIRLFKFEPQKVSQYLKQRDIYKQLKSPQLQQAAQNGVQQDVIDFASIAGMHHEMQHFLKYEPVAKSTDFTHLQGKAISDAMSDKEYQNYLKSWDVFKNNLDK